MIEGRHQSREQAPADERKIEPEKASEMAEYREQAKEFATTYRGVVDYLSGSVKSFPEAELSNEADKQRWAPLVSGLQQGLRRQQDMLARQSADKEVLLAEVLSKLNVSLTPEELAQVEVANQDRVPTVFIPLDLFYKKVRKGNASAFAYTPAEGISLVVLPKSPEADYNQRIVEENVPHETHHVGWKWARRYGHLANNEAGNFRQASFGMYQDEMMARTVSEGALFGYTHLILLSPDEAAKERLANNEDHQAVAEIVSELNDLARSIQYAFLERETGLSKAEVGLAVFRATTFEDLRHSFQELKAHLESFPTKSSAKSDGWGSITT